MDVQEHAEQETVLLDPSNSMATFTSIMDTLASGAAEEKAGAGAEALPTDAGSNGLPTAGVEAAGGNSVSDAGTAAGDGGVGGLPPEGSASGGGEPGIPGESSGVDAATLTDTFAEISTKLEANMNDSMLESSLAVVREEYGNYFNALEQHPRMLVGQEVPSLNGEGMETLRDSADAKEWQEAVKNLLSREVQDRASRQGEEMAATFDTLHASVDLFKNNPDLIPGTKQFNRGLADEFASLVKDYEVRNEAGKLIGYGLQVQPLINNLRAQMKSRTVAETSKPTAPAPSGRPVQQQPAPPAPQPGILSSAGSSGGDSSSDFSTLFGTLGMPDLVI